MKRIRTGLVGCGKVGRIHASALSRLPESEFVAVCDQALDRAQAFAHDYRVQPFTDVRAMLAAARVEAVLVATPHPLHAEATLAAAEAGTHVLVEKPLAANLAD